MSTNKPETGWDIFSALQAESQKRRHLHGVINKINKVAMDIDLERQDTHDRDDYHARDERRYIEEQVSGEGRVWSVYGRDHRAPTHAIYLKSVGEPGHYMLSTQTRRHWKETTVSHHYHYEEHDISALHDMADTPMDFNQTIQTYIKWASRVMFGDSYHEPFLARLRDTLGAELTGATPPPSKQASPPHAGMG